MASALSKSPKSTRSTRPAGDAGTRRAGCARRAGRWHDDREHAERQPRRRDRADERELGGGDELGARPEPVHRRVAGHEPQERELGLAPLAHAVARRRVPGGRSRPVLLRDVVVALAAGPVVGDPPGGELDLAVDERRRQVAVVRHADQREVALGRAAATSAAVRSARACSSSPANGSSSTSARGRAASAPAITTRRASPPLSSSTRRGPIALGSNPTSAQRTATRRPATRPTPRSPRPNTVGRSSCRRECWNATPTCPTTRAAAVDPRAAPRPRSDRAGPASTHASVDLPEPLCPTTSTASPRSIRRFTSASARCAHGVLPRVHVADVAEQQQRITAPRAPGAATSGSVVHGRAGTGTTRPASSAIVRSADALSADAVRHVHHRHAVARHERAQQREQLHAARAVDHRRGLVGDQQLRAPGERGRHREPLQLAAGEGRRLAVGERAQADAFEQRVDVDRRAGRRLLHAPHDVVADAHAEHLQLRAAGTRSRSRRARRGRLARAGPPRRSSARRPASTRPSVDFPDPLGPTIATSSPGVDLDRDVVQHVGGRRRDSGSRPSGTSRVPASGAAPAPVARGFVAESTSAFAANASRTRRSVGAVMRCASHAAITTITSRSAGIVIHQSGQQPVDESGRRDRRCVWRDRPVQVVQEAAHAAPPVPELRRAADSGTTRTRGAGRRRSARRAATGTAPRRRRCARRRSRAAAEMPTTAPNAPHATTDVTTGMPSTRKPTVDAATVPATTARRRLRAASTAIGTTATTTNAVPTGITWLTITSTSVRSASTTASASSVAREAPACGDGASSAVRITVAWAWRAAR